MNKDTLNIDNRLNFTAEAKLKHENKYLKERLDNLEIFKKNFFATNLELIEAKQKISLYEEQFEIEKLKQRITGLPEPFDGSANQDKEINQDVLSFFKESFSANVYRDVVASMFHSVEGLGVDVTVQVSVDEVLLNHSLDESVQSDNLALIEQYNSTDEIVEHDDYIIFYLSSISFLAKNMPVSDSAKKEQIKEFLYVIALGSNSRIDVLYKDIALETLRKNVYKILRKTRVSFEQMQDNVDNQTIAISELYLNFEKMLTDSLKKINLTDSHMQMFKLLIHEARTDLNLLLTSGLTLDQQFLSTIIKLESAYAENYADIDI